MNPERLSDASPYLRALVTGASSGIGAAFAAHLARDGYASTIVARHRARLEAEAKRLRKLGAAAVDVVAADLTDAADLRRVEKRITEGPALDLLVNNAGFGTTGSFARLDPAREEEEIRLNVVALVRLTRAALPRMIARGRGAIVNVSSMAAFQPGPYMATYGATKAFVNSFTEALHEELRGTGVRVQVLCPGFTRTAFPTRAGVDVSRIPSFVWMSPEAVVAASLAGLERGELVCVPGLANRALVTLTGAVPRGLTRRVAGTISRQVLG
ncbi:MAG: SDR family NAD(P)-dependent oxidoreductase [Candidatus Binatia bacterium]